MVTINVRGESFHRIKCSFNNLKMTSISTHVYYHLKFTFYHRQYFKYFSLKARRISTPHKVFLVHFFNEVACSYRRPVAYKLPKTETITTVL